MIQFVQFLSENLSYGYLLMKTLKIKSRKEDGFNCEMLFLEPEANAINEGIEFVRKTDADHLIISCEQFPDHLSDNLNVLLKEIENNKNIVSLYYDSALITPNQIKLFLTPEILKKMIYGLSSAALQNAKVMLDSNILIFNEEIYDTILADPSLRKVLSDYKPTRQVFRNSCAAHSIMEILYEKENPTRCSILTEMEIYREIWMAPGEFSCPHKIQIFLTSHNREMIFVEDEERVKKIISSRAEMKNQYEYVKSLFDPFHQRNNGINDASFPNNSDLLLVVEWGRHMIFAKRLENGDIELHNTNGVAIRKFVSLESFVDSRDELEMFDGNERSIPSLFGFSGIAFSLFQSRQVNSEKKESVTLAKNQGGFGHPQSK